MLQYPICILRRIKSICYRICKKWQYLHCKRCCRNDNKEIVANIKSDDLEILFRMDSGYFDEKIIETIESLGCKYLIKAKSYSTLTSQATNSSIVFVKGEEGRETTEPVYKIS